jgi:crotonobetaine/carnitine-CoA ligase
VPSELGEDEVMAFVVLRAGAEPDPVGLVRHCEPRLAYFAIPRFVDFVDALPLTENGKVRKYALRERGVGPQTWDREAAGVSLRR